MPTTMQQQTSPAYPQQEELQQRQPQEPPNTIKNVLDDVLEPVFNRTACLAQRNCQNVQDSLVDFYLEHHADVHLDQAEVTSKWPFERGGAPAVENTPVRASAPAAAAAPARIDASVSAPASLPICTPASARELATTPTPARDLQPVPVIGSKTAHAHPNGMVALYLSHGEFDFACETLKLLASYSKVGVGEVAAEGGGFRGLEGTRMLGAVVEGVEALKEVLGVEIEGWEGFIGRVIGLAEGGRAGESVNGRNGMKRGRGLKERSGSKNEVEDEEGRALKEGRFSKKEITKKGEEDQEGDGKDEEAAAKKKLKRKEKKEKERKNKKEGKGMAVQERLAKMEVVKKGVVRTGKVML